MIDPPTSFSQVVGTAISIWRRNFLFYLLIAAISMLPQLAGLAVPDDVPVLGLGLSLVSLFITILTQGAGAYFSVRQVEGAPVSGAEAFRAALARGAALLWTGILALLWIILGFILLIVPGVLWAFNYCLAPVVVMVEGLSGSAALARSKQLVNANRNLAANIVVGLPLLLLICMMPVFFVEVTFMLKMGLVVNVVGQLFTTQVFMICWISVATMFTGLRAKLESKPDEGVGFSRF